MDVRIPAWKIMILLLTSIKDVLHMYFFKNKFNFFQVYGCMDSSMFNYNANANTDQNCIPKVVGCMDNAARNYDSLANTEP